MERDNQIILAETLSVIPQLTLISYLPGNTIWVVSSFSFSFRLFFFVEIVKYPFDTNPTLSEEKAARSRPCVHETLCICSVRLPGWECRRAYTWQRRRWDSLGRDVPGGAGSSACPEALCELNVKCTAHYIYVAVTLCNDSLSVRGRALSFKTLRAGFLWHQLVSVENPPATKYQESVLLSPLMKWRRCTESEWMFKK